MGQVLCIAVGGADGVNIYTHPSPGDTSASAAEVELVFVGRLHRLEPVASLALRACGNSRGAVLAVGVVDGTGALWQLQAVAGVVQVPDRRLWSGIFAGQRLAGSAVRAPPSAPPWDPTTSLPVPLTSPPGLWSH